MPNSLRVVHIGLGSIGQTIARMVLETPGLRLIGAADIAPDKAGKDLGTILGFPRKLRIKTETDPARLIRSGRADIAILATSSTIRDVKPHILALVHKGIHVITTCEELAYPTPAHLGSYREIDHAARAKKAAVLAAGVNPGFAMDALALMLTAPCAEVKRVSATRVVDASTRRLPLQRKVGAGLNLNQFRRAISEGSVRHVGLIESAHMIAGSLGWKLERIEETIEPAIAPRDLDTEHLRIPAGCAAGVKQYVRGYRNGDLAVSLDLQMYVGAESPRDHILIDGVPPLDMTIAGGLSGDIATAAIVINSIPRLLTARPGLLSMKDIPLVHRYNPADMKALSARSK